MVRSGTKFLRGATLLRGISYRLVKIGAFARIPLPCHVRNTASANRLRPGMCPHASSAPAAGMHSIDPRCALRPGVAFHFASPKSIPASDPCRLSSSRLLSVKDHPDPVLLLIIDF